MNYGFSFFEILVSEITMILASIVFVVGVGSLILFRKRLSVTTKIIISIILIFTTLYLLFIAWLVIGFGSYGI